MQPLSHYAMVSTPPRNLLIRPTSRSPFSLSTARTRPSKTVSTSSSNVPVHKATTLRYLISMSLLRLFSDATPVLVSSVRFLRACIRARKTVALGMDPSSLLSSWLSSDGRDWRSASQDILLSSRGPWLCSSLARRFCSSSRPRDKLNTFCRVSNWDLTAVCNESRVLRASFSCVDVDRNVACNESRSVCFFFTSAWKLFEVSLRRCVMAGECQYTSL